MDHASNVIRHVHYLYAVSYAEFILKQANLIKSHMLYIDTNSPPTWQGQLSPCTWMLDFIPCFQQPNQPILLSCTLPEPFPHQE